MAEKWECITEAFEALNLVKKYHQTLHPDDQARMVNTWSDEYNDFDEIEENYDDEMKGHTSLEAAHAMLNLVMHWFEWAVDEAVRNDQNPD